MTPPSLPAGSDKLPREERRRRTEATILDAARELFAEHGFAQTTIRAVAARAGIDPALVMQYYGNKEGLFAASARWHVDDNRLAAASLGDVPLAALDALFRGMDDPARRDASIALLRSCLTHETALGIMRDDVLCEPQAVIAKTIGGSDAELRAGLLGATIIGITIAKYLLEIPAVADASRGDIERIMTPVLRELVGAPDEGPT